MMNKKLKMVNTFITSSSVKDCAKNLGWKHLGKQRVEAYQIWRVLNGFTKGWKNHPAVKMWEGHQCALALYCNTMIDEWIARGYQNTMKKLPHCKTPRFPWWWNWDPLIKSHQASLNRKMPSVYSFDVGEYAQWGYVWPSKIPSHMRTDKFNFSSAGVLRVTILDGREMDHPNRDAVHGDEKTSIPK
jgi:hypothetical protein